MPISRDTFDDSKNYQRVVEQAGVAVVDNELNEAQKIGEVRATEFAASATSGVRATGSGMSFLFAAEDGFQAYASGSPGIFLKAGDAHVDGYRLTAAGDIDLVAHGFAFPVVGGSAVYGYVAMDLVETEVDSSVDPNIATPYVGETSTRIQLQVTYQQAESTASFEAALATLAALPAAASPPARVWKGDVARAIVCRYVRPAASTNITSDMIVDLRAALPGEHLIQRPFMKTLRATNLSGSEGSGVADGMVIWDLVHSRLQIGIPSAVAAAQAARNGLLIRTAAAPDHYISNSQATPWVLNGAANADGTPIPVNWSFGYQIGDGEALGYTAVGIPSVSTRTAFLTKKTLNDSPRAGVYAVTPTPPSYTVPQLVAQRLQVTSIDDFTGDPGSFILCTRMGEDLVWWNGVVTRGDVALPVFVDPGGVQGEYNAIVGQHVTQSDGVERVLNLTAASSTLLGTSRCLRFRVQSGVWSFARGLKRYGSASELASMSLSYAGTNNSITMEGAGAESTRVVLSNPLASARSSSAVAVCSMVAATITLRGITFDQIESAAFAGSYVLSLEGFHVTLEDCHFRGPVKIKADQVSIRNCRFDTLSNSYTLFPSATASNGIVAGCLFLEARSTGIPTALTADKCQFNIGPSVGPMAAVVLNCNEPLAAYTLRHCDFSYADDPAAIMAGVHLNGYESAVRILHSDFVGATGVNKPGYNVPTDGDASPFNGNNKGSVLQGTSSTKADHVACAYISATRGRSLASKTVVAHNNFDLGSVYATQRFSVWGAMMCVFTGLTVGGSTTTYANIRYQHNSHAMYLEGSGSWDSTGAALTDPATFGFYLAPLWQDSTSLTNVLVSHVSIADNTFDIGGHNSTTLVQDKTWRSPFVLDPTSWAASTVHFLTDGGCLIGIVLRNGTIGANTYSGRSGTAISVTGNMISQRELSGAGVVTGAVVTLAVGLAGSYTAWFIRLDAGDWSNNAAQTGPTVGGSNAQLTSGNCLVAPVVQGNRIEALCYVRNVAIVALEVSLIFVGGAYEGLVTGNHLQGNTSVDGPTGAWFAYSKQGLASGNTIKAGVGLSGGSTDYGGGNLLKGCNTAAAGAIVGLYNSGSNFT